MMPAHNGVGAYKTYPLRNINGIVVGCMDGKDKNLPVFQPLFIKQEFIFCRPQKIDDMTDQKH